jgi:hypothetical protein
MLLRRFVEHLNAQNWVAVGLDLFIVILGVFLGFQLTAWNQARQDRALEHEYLERLFTDMVGSIEDYKVPALWNERSLETQALALQALRSGVLAEKDRADFDRGVIYVGVHNPVVRRWGTAEELISTGNISLIGNLALRTQIAQTEAVYERISRLTAIHQGEALELRARMLGKLDPVKYRLTPDAPTIAGYDFGALAADKQFISLFANANLKSKSIDLFHKEYMSEMEALRDTLADILGIDPETARTTDPIASTSAGVVFSQDASQSAEPRDPAILAPHIYQVALENERVRVLRVTVRPDEIPPLHSHPDRVLVYVNGCTGLLPDKDGGMRQVTFNVGDVGWAPGETHGDQANTVEKDCQVLEVELK